MHPARPRSAFTLIEMAIVLVIVGLLAGLTLPVVGDLIKREKSSAASGFLEKARNEIIGYAIKNKHLPSAIDGTDTDFGALGKDPYGNSLVYWVDSALANSANSLCDTDAADDLTLRHRTGSGATDYTDYGKLGFILLSTGRNADQEYTEPSTYTVQVWDPRAYTGTGEFDDQYAYASLNYLRSKICSPSETSSGSDAPEGSDISYAQDMQDFSGGSNASNTAQSATGYVTVNADNSLTIGSNTSEGYGCSWYQGDNGNCSNGKCIWGNGSRAYFEFKSASADTSGDSKSYGDGFTFTMMSAASQSGNSISKCGGSGDDMGYADSGSGSLTPPKMAVEYDMYPNDSKNDTTNGNNHLAIVFWASSRGDDNEHNVRVRTPSPNDPYRNPDSANSDAGFEHVSPTAAGQWMEDGTTYATRVEVAATSSTSANTYAATAWVKRCDGTCDAAMSDLTAAYGGTATSVTDTLELDTSDNDQQFETFYFGWTMGTGSKRQQMTLSNFGIKFLN